MQIAVRTIVYDPNSDETERSEMGRIVFIAEAHGHDFAIIIDFRIVEANKTLPDFQGARINLTGEGNLPEVEKDGNLICYFCGEAAHYDENDAAQHYISLCQESGATKPSP